jgi:hypothetical protein
LRKKKRDLKRKNKKTLKSQKEKVYNPYKPIKRNGNKPILDGVSIFELIIPWKAETIRQSKEGKKA